MQKAGKRHLPHKKTKPGTIIANCDRYIEPQPPPQHRGVPQGSFTGAAPDPPAAGADITLNWRSNFG